MNDDPEAGARGLAIAMLLMLTSAFWLSIGVWIGAHL